MNRQAESCPPGAYRPAGKTIDLSPNPGRVKLLMLHSDLFYPFVGTKRKETQYKYPWWLSYGAGGWGGKERNGPHDEHPKMVLVYHLSIRTLDLVYGPRCTVSPPASREVLGQPLATSWGSHSFKAAIRALLGGSYALATCTNMPNSAVSTLLHPLHPSSHPAQARVLDISSQDH